MKKWIAILLIIAMTGGLVCYADDLNVEDLEVFFEDDSPSSEIEMDIEFEDSDIPEEQEELLLDDIVIEDNELMDLELSSELSESNLEIDLSENMVSNGINSSLLYGVWVGTYIGTQNGNIIDRTIRLDIDNIMDNSIEGIATIDGGENGSYFFDGTLNIDNGSIEFCGTDWIENPSNFGFATFYGLINESEQSITGTVDGNDTRTFSLHKESDSFVSKRINIQAVPKDWKGEYDGLDGHTVVRRNFEFHIQAINSEGNIRGIATFSPSDKADSMFGANGRYYFDGTIDGRRGKIELQGNEWIEYPDKDLDWTFVVLEGFFDSSLASISGKSEHGIWEMKAYDSELDDYYSKQPDYPIRIGNNHQNKENYAEFNESLERYITNMDSGTYHPELAYMLMALAGAAYNEKRTQGGLLSRENAGYQSASKELYHITKAYEDLGFSDYTPYNYYNNPNDAAYGGDNAAFTIGRKQLSDDEALVLIVVRGSYGEILSFTSDWQSNTKIKTNSKGRHLGFARAADNVYKALKSFLKSRHYSDTAIKTNIRYVITGHSRGAAVANLLAVKLHDMGVPNSRVYDYNFACPDTVKGFKLANLKKNHENIFNICNSADAVSVIPGIVGDTASGTGSISGLEYIKEKFKSLFVSWGKYGTTWYYCKNWDLYQEFDLLRTFDEDNSPHDYKYYVPDLRENKYKFYSWKQIVLRRIELGVPDAVNRIINIFYPTYAFNPADITKAKVTVNDQVYTGKALEPSVKVVLNKKTLKKDKDYSVSYKDNIDVGSASVTVTGKGKFAGYVKVTFKIKPKPVKGLKLKSGKGECTASWTKSKGIDGYQLEYYHEIFSSTKNTVTIKKAKTVEKTIKFLNNGQTYCVRIRAYKKVKGKYYWSAWSSVKKIKVK